MSRSRHMQHDERPDGRHDMRLVDQPPVREAETQAIASFLRSLAARVEVDPALALAVRTALYESGLLSANAGVMSGSTPAVQIGKHAVSRPSLGRAESAGTGAAAPDPFVLYREQGEAAL